MGVEYSQPTGIHPQVIDDTVYRSDFVGAHLKEFLPVLLYDGDCFFS